MCVYSMDPLLRSILDINHPLNNNDRGIENSRGLDPRLDH